MISRVGSVTVASLAALNILSSSVQSFPIAKRNLSTTTTVQSISAIGLSSNTNNLVEIKTPAPAIVVQPGTSPVEEQPIRNPINYNSTVLVIGGTRSIGLEFVKQCVDKDATVIFTHRSESFPSSLTKLKTELEERKAMQVSDEVPVIVGSIHGLQMDLSDEDSIMAASEEYKKRNLPPISHIIHNAGIYRPETSFDGSARGPRAAAPKVTKDALMETYMINTIAPLLVAQHFVPLLKKIDSTVDSSSQRKSTLPILAFVSSKVGSVDDNGSGGAYAYRSSKSALNQIAKSLSIDLAGEAQVILLHPGYVRTDMTGGNGLIDVDESVSGMLKAVEATDESIGFRFVDYKACQIPW